MRKKGPIFLDPKGRRARYTNAALLIVALLSIVAFTVLTIGVIWAPPIIQPRLNKSVSVYGIRQKQTRPLSPQEEPFHGTGGRESSKAHASVLHFAFYSMYDPASFLSLRRHVNQLDGLLPDWYSLSTSNGRITLEKDPKAEPLLAWLRSHSQSIALFPQVSLQLNNPLLQQLFLNDSKRKLLEAQIARSVTRDDLSGVTINVKEVGAELRRPLMLFVRDLGSLLRANGRKLLISVDPNLDKGLVRELAAAADYVIVRTADELQERWTTGPVASQGWFESAVWKDLASIPPAKLVISVGSFGYDYDASGYEQLISVQRAWDLLADTGSALDFDKRSLNSTFAYKASDGQWHQVWFTDAVSVFNQLRTAIAVAPAGVALWRLGTEDPSLWTFAARGAFPDQARIKQLTTVPAGFGSLEPSNPALALFRAGNPGTRKVHFNPALGLIDDEMFTAFPRRTKVKIWPAKHSKTIALTFDDGPSATYTPEILDILAKRHVKATFYVIGENALANLDVLRRMYREGHDIGSHSFSHPNLADCSKARVVAELNATQRLLQSELGITTNLFRAPYEDSDFGSLDESTQLIKIVRSLGYLWGGFNVDPDDYLRLPSQSEWIVDDVLRQVHEGDGPHVILLHDGGGNREATVKALPKIIDRLRAEGYRFVSTHAFVGLPRGALMPRSSLGGALAKGEISFRFGSIETIAGIADAIPPIAIVTAILGVLRLALIVIVAGERYWRRPKISGTSVKVGSIAVLVPAHNEEAVICKTVRALVEGCSRRDFEVIVIDDGSTDATADVVQKTFAGEPRVKVFTKPNGGKSSALDFGYGKTTSEIVIAIDGDTVLEPDAIEKLVQPFRDPSVGAVAGKVVVGNQVNLIARFQALEYATSQTLDRAAFEPFNAICVVPGAIGAWRRKAVLQVGGYSDDNLAEDADLTVRLALAGWRVVSCLEARALTEAPESLRGFLKQRFRWMFGMLQVAYKHVGALFGRPTGISLISIPNIVIFQFGFTLLAPIMDAILCWDVLMTLGAILGLTNFLPETLVRVGLYCLIFQIADLLAAAAGLFFNGERRYWRLLPLVFLQRFTYRQLLYWTAVKVLITAIRGAFVGWGRLVRTGNVAVPASKLPGA